MGRSPDYKAAFLATLGGNADFYAPYQDNARRWYRLAQERVLFLNHALVQPPVDRHRPPDEVADVYVHVEKETDAGLVLSGAKVVATGSALTHANFIAHPATTPIKSKAFGAVFIAPDEHARREADVPAVLRDGRRGDGQPLRLSAQQPHGRERRHPRPRPRPGPLGERPHLRGSGEVGDLLPALRLLRARHAARLHAPGREARLHPGPHAQGRRGGRLGGQPQRAGLHRRGDRLAQSLLGPHRLDDAEPRAVVGHHRAARIRNPRRPTGSSPPSPIRA